MSRLRAAFCSLLCVVGIGVTTAVPVAASSRTVKVEQVVCKHPHNARARCLAIRVDRIRHGRIRHAMSPIGYTPRDLQAAYSLPSASRGANQTIAIVDAYDDPMAERDLAVYRSEFGLPPCTTASGCFRKLDEDGGRDYPEADGGWSQEVSLDLDMASAVCPNCDLMLVEASTPSMVHLGTAEKTAARLGANAISNSWGGPDAKDRYYGRYFHHPGVAVTASTGDSGYAVSYPAASKWVIAVGGTTLRRTGTSRGFTESAWNDSGSGCSTVNTTTWQTPTTGCDGRAVADVAAVADPATGVAVYDSFAFDDTAGWLTFGGTSASAPIIAGVYALAGDMGEAAIGATSLWTHHSHLHDITSGSNGTCPTPQWCTARRGWDGPTGWGTPNGISDF